MVGQQRSARRRHEGRQAPQQRQGIEEQRRGAVAPGPAKLIQELPTRPLRESLQGQGRAQNVAADPLQLIPPPRRHCHIRVQAATIADDPHRVLHGNGSTIHRMCHDRAEVRSFGGWMVAK